MAADRKRTKGPKSSPMTDLPRQEFVRNGFGTGKVHSSEWRSRIAATSFVLEIIKSRSTPENTLQMHHSIHMVRDMFRAIHAGDTYDWFSTSRFLGHPSAELCKSLYLDLAALRGAIRSRDVVLFNRTIDHFVENYGYAMLENHLRMTVDHGHKVCEEGWAYILWTSSDRGVLHIGATSGEIDEVLRRLDRENPDQHPYGVLSAWLVHDAALADEDIHAEFRGYALDRGLFRVDLGHAKERISSLLHETDNFALSPWHDYEPHRDAKATPLALCQRLAG